MEMLDVDRYLERIGYAGPRDPSADALRELQLAHMTSVPFENLHVVAGFPVSTATEWSVPKVVDRREGGWCFELNGAFGALLQALGYPVRYHSARVWDAQALDLGPPLDHLSLSVVADGERWLVDVGFGDSSVTPVRLDTPDEQDRQPRRCRIEESDGLIRYLEWMHWDDWEVQYALDPSDYSLDRFQPRCDELASGAGGGYFTTKPFATRALDDQGSRVWLLKERLKVRHGGGHEHIEETPVGPDSWLGLLQSWFGMALPEAGLIIDAE